MADPNQKEVIEACLAHVEHVISLSKACKIPWVKVPTPNTAMTAFNGVFTGYNIMLCRSSIEKEGIQYFGVIATTDSTGMAIVKMTNTDAEALYMQAESNNN